MITRSEARQEIIRRALLDPEFHRAKFSKRPLLWPQVKAVKMVEEAMAKAMRVVDSQSVTMTIRSARQTMKNEVAGVVHVRALVRHAKTGGSIIRTAPTYAPQLVNSKLRLETEINRDPLISKAHVRKREGNIVQYGEARVQFLSTAPGASTEGATASLLLDIDEAHLVNRGRFHEAFSPMTSMYGSPTVMFGVAASKHDLLYEHLCFNLGGQKAGQQKSPEELGLAGKTIIKPEIGVLQFPASLWCEFLPRYRAQYANRVALLGADNTWILTQYDLIDVENLGGFLKPFHIKSITSGTHDALLGPRQSYELEYVAVIDIGGEDEEGEELDPEAKSSGRRDSTVMYIFEVDHNRERAALHNGIPTCRAVYAVWWTGKTMAADPAKGLQGQQELLLKLLKRFRVERFVVDARGVGFQIATHLTKNHPGGVAYAASGSSVSQDIYTFWGMVANDCIKLWRPGSERLPSGGLPTAPVDRELVALRAETVEQLQKTGREIYNHDQVRLVKPAGGGHIDHTKALTYLPRCLAEDRPFRAGMIHQPFHLFGG